MLELQITKEYLGFATHLAYLGPLYEEVLRADTYARGEGSTVAKVIDGSLHGYAHTGIAGVANIGTDRNWSGSHFDQANWYAFGRLAWNPDARLPRTSRDEWVRMTFTNDATFVARVVEMMMGSRQAVVDYMTPLGLHHLMARVITTARSRGSMAARARTGRPCTIIAPTRKASVSIAARAAATPSRSTPHRSLHEFGDLQRVPRGLPAVVPSRALGLPHAVRAARCGTSSCIATRAAWMACARCARPGMSSRPLVDARAHEQVAAFLRIQEKEAKWWRDACIAYFQTFSQRPIPSGLSAAASIRSTTTSRSSFPYAPGH